MPLANLDPNFAVRDAADNLLWYDVQELGIEGRGFPDTRVPYDRLPARAEGLVRDPVWTLQQHSAGMAVRFVSNAPTIGVKWRLRFPELAMPHMAATGVSGLDLYMREGDQFRWVAIGVPREFPDNTATLQGAPDGTACEFLLYLPLYNGVESVRMGVPEGALLGKAPPWPGGPHRPICFYGTSITQGGCASRPGMAYPSIVGRRLNRPVLNFGFSGNGQAETEMADLLAELDCAAYVLDPLPNLAADQVAIRLERFARILRQAHADTPIVLVESITPTRTLQAGLAGTGQVWAEKNAGLRAAHGSLRAGGMAGLHYVAGGDLLGHDFEGTVDGVHATDIGFMRMAEAFTGALQPVV